MLNSLDPDSLETIFRFCSSDELLSLYCVHPKLLKVMEKLETLHMNNNNQNHPNSSVNNNNLNNDHVDDGQKNNGTNTVATPHHLPTTYSPFLKPSNQKECEETKYRLQIFHPSYTAYVMNSFSTSMKDVVCEWAQYLVENLNFKLILDDGNSLIVEREIFKSSFVKNLRGKLTGMVQKIEETGKTVNKGITAIIDTEFKPYSNKNKQCLINFYERFTLRIVFKRKLSIPNNFVLASGQTFYLYQGNSAGHRYPGLDCSSTSDFSDQIIGVKTMIDHFGLNSTVCDLMLCTILQHRMPKYYFENYRVPEDLDQAQYLALVDVFYYEMLNSENRLNAIPVFLTQSYLNTPFELFKYGLEMCFDLLYNQLSTRKKIGLVEKLISTYLDQEFTPEQLQTIHSHSSLLPQDLKSNKYTSVYMERESLIFTVVCLETTTTIKMKNPNMMISIDSITNDNAERVKVVTQKIMEYTFQLPNLFNGNIIGSVKIGTKSISAPPTNNNNVETTTIQPAVPRPSNNFCLLL